MPEAASAIFSAIKTALQNKMLCTLDVSGFASTVVMGQAIMEVLAEIRDEFTMRPDHQ